MPPAVTFARIRPLAAAAGVTRLGDVTGLDTIGIPVFHAIRPRARSVSVSQGKGATRMAARVSALMEAIELDRAECVAADTFGPAEGGKHDFCAAIDPAFDPARPRGWCAATDLLTGQAMRVPHALVSMDLAQPIDDRLRPSSNGLASGNDLAEATVAALCELIERDAHARWLDSGRAARRASAIDPATIDDRLVRRLIAKVARAGFGLRLWQMGERAGVSTVGCAILELARGGAVLAPAFGAGTHPDPHVALARAITEAAQVRATLIAGARDDLTPADYADPDRARLRVLIDAGDEPGRRWQSPMRDDLCRPALERLLDVCRANGARWVARIDLGRAGEPISIVKLIVPGFANPHGQCGRA